MVAKRPKRFESGEASQYMSRNAALKKLQLNLKNFRKLCIIKGIYPREPKHRRRAQKGAPGIKTLYFKKDIQFLMHEPIIWKLRDYRIFHKRLGRAKAIKDFETMKRYMSKHPSIKLDHIVKERYPTFIDAVRDLDDCLTLCFLFATFPALRHIPRDQMMLCRRLTVEFLHAVIEAKALRKVFISIKGYYYQAEIKGETITWIVPHHFSFEPQAKAEVDFKIMSTFVEFYVIMLGFVNFRLYNSLNLFYPPIFSASANPSIEEKSLVDEEVYVAERVSALNVLLSKTSHEVEEEIDLDIFAGEDNPEKMEEARKEAESIKTLKTLFKGLKIFLNREVPREPLVFVIRCFGGEVSWDKLSFVGSTFEETDESITHQIVDRPSMEKQFISRYYLQPQWIFDCVNARQLLPVNKYFMGEILPPHLSPFVDKDRDQSYIPPEEMALYDPELLEKMHKDEEVDDAVEDDEEEGSEEVEEEEEQIEEDDLSDIDESKPKLKVTPGEVYKEEPYAKQKTSNQEYRLREKMIKAKHRNLYKSMMKGREGRLKDAWLLKKKRRTLDENDKQEKKKKAKAASSSTVESSEETTQNHKKDKQDKKSKASLNDTKQVHELNKGQVLNKNDKKDKKKKAKSSIMESLEKKPQNGGLMAEMKGEKLDENPKQEKRRRTTGPVIKSYEEKKQEHGSYVRRQKTKQKQIY